MSVYDACPVLENESFLLRLFRPEDRDDLLKVYSDKNALPFFNSDNCDGDNFYYDTPEKMARAMDFWRMSYENGWFARLSVEDKRTAAVVGTVELCLRVSDDSFNNMCILRLDVRSDYENEAALYALFSLITPECARLTGGQGVLTKAPLYAVERIRALQKSGFTRSDELLIGKTGYPYDGYWTV